MTGELLAIALGMLVGLSLGALGGGGSTLAVPILVFVAGFGAQEAITASLVVVGLAAAVGVVSHLRRGHVRLGTGVAFGAAGIVGSRIGLLVNRSLDEQVLLLAFAALVVVVAVRMLRSAEPAPAEPAGRGEPVGPSENGPPDGRAATVATVRRVSAPPRLDLSGRALVELGGAATAVGFLTGLFGVGGGFAVVPALTLLLRVPTKHAIGTSLVVIVVNAAIALALRSGEFGVDWTVVGPFAATVTLGVVFGTRIAERTAADRLTRAFAVMLGLVAVATAASTILTA